MAPSEPTHVEVERKFVVDDARRLDLSAVAGVDWVREVPAVELAAVYYDTVDLRLGHLGVELRRRSGGHDAGWHLKVPVKADEKIEIRAPLDDGEAEVPERLSEAVLGLTGGGPLLPAATVDTRRRESELVAAGGRTLAVVALDEVDAQRLIPSPGRAVQWHEVEVELVEGPPKTVKRVAKRLGQAGAEPAPWASKVGRVLDLPDPDPGSGSATPTNAGDAVVHYVRRHVTALLLGDVAVRTRQPDGIHDMRVATRRLRSTLATFRPFLDGPRWEAARAELQWMGRLLGGVRDLDVLEARLLAEIDDQEPLLVIGPVRARTRRELSVQRRDAREALDDALHSDRHLALLDELRSLAAEPPLTRAAASKPARAVERVDRAVRRVEKAMTRAAGAAGERGPERDDDLHDIRKAAKRARYAAEAVRPVRGKRARRLARTMQDVQDVLGEHQDAVTARPVLRDLGVRAYLAGENGFTFGLLSRAEESNADAARERYRALRPRVRRARNRFS